MPTTRTKVQPCRNNRLPEILRDIMPLKLMYITNRPDIAQIAESAGVDRIFIDMEHIGKSARQGGMDTVQSHHTVEDIARVRAAVTTAQLMVRVNPIHDATPEYGSTEEEVEAAIAAGADILMLPYFKTAEEVRRFIRAVRGRVRTLLLLETAEGVACIDEILGIPGIDEMFIGLNDLSLSYGMKFMFQLLADGTVERLCTKFKAKGLPYGFGGIAAMGCGTLPAEQIIKEHYRLGSTCVILSRSFCNADNVGHIGSICSTFMNGVRAIREFEKECESHARFFADNTRSVRDKVNQISSQLAAI